MRKKIRKILVPCFISTYLLTSTLGLSIFPNYAIAAVTNDNGWEVKDLSSITDPVKTPEQLLVESLLGSDVQVSNIQLKGVEKSAGIFKTDGNIIGFNEGIVLSSGNVHAVIGPNKSDNTSYDNGLTGDSDLESLIQGDVTNDATVLEFDFIPQNEKISFQYVFSSEEYNEYVNSYNDVFGFFLNGQNVAKLPDSDVNVSINNVNKFKNSQYYINNDLSDGIPKINTEMDGMTVALSVNAAVKVGELNHIKIAIADAGDSALDSNVFIKAKSFTDKPNTPPLAVDDIVKTKENTPIIIDALGNDTDVDNDPLMITQVSQPTNGTVSINANGASLNYSPNPDFTGIDTFTYTISDGKGGVASANVKVNVITPNQAPVASDDSVTTNEFKPININVLGNDNDLDGDPLTVKKVSNPTNGSVTINPDGTITYSPNLGFNGVDTFKYTISDGKGGEASAKVSVNVTAAKSMTGYMSGGGSINTPTGDKVSYNFQVFSKYIPTPSALDVKWNNDNFKLSNLTQITLVRLPIISGANTTYVYYAKGAGTGAYNGQGGATIEFFFSDSGKGSSDTVQFVIKDAKGNTVLSSSGNLIEGDNASVIF